MTNKYKDQIAVASFYSFVNIEEPGIIMPKVILASKRNLLKGTVLVANEGFNGSLSGPEEKVMKVLDYIKEITSAREVIWKINYCEENPFSRLKVKLKKEIVTIGIKDLDVNSLKGKYIETHEWDKAIAEDNTIIIDTRNDYEVEIGTFSGSLNPNTKTFREFPNWAQNHEAELKDKKILMFCTGGVRCEKSTALLKSMGHDEVYHLKGGILQYLEDTGNKNNMWKGECFVFDERDVVDDHLKPQPFRE